MEKLGYRTEVSREDLGINENNFNIYIPHEHEDHCYTKLMFLSFEMFRLDQIQIVDCREPQFSMGRLQMSFL